MVRMSTLADCLKTMTNAEKRGKRQALIRPASSVIIRVLKVMQKHGYIGVFFRVSMTERAETPLAKVAPPNRFFDALVPELLEIISDFLGASPFSRVGEAVYHAIAGRHLRVRLSWAKRPKDRIPPPGPALETLFRLWLQRIHTLNLEVPGREFGSDSHVSCLRKLRVLTDAPALQRLRLAVSWSTFTPGAGEGLVEATRAPRLRTLELEFISVSFSPESLETLRGLAEAPHIETFAVSIKRCSMEGTAASLLANLSRMPRLTDLAWEAEGHTLEEGDFQIIARIGQAQCLRRLDLDLSHHAIGPGEAAPLRALGTMQMLEDLRLTLTSNDLGPPDAVALAELCNAPRLTHLVLSLGDNRLQSLGISALAGLSQCPVLQNLTLNLEGNSIAGGGSLPLQRLASIPTLRSVVIDLSFNGITAADAPFLCAFRTATQLTEIDINLEDTPYADRAPPRFVKSRGSAEPRPRT